MTAQRYVLVVDDEQRLTSFLKEFLSKAGYQMHVASSGQEALDAVKAHVPALVLLDMRMPGIDGVQVLQTLKREYRPVKVIVMTSYDEEYKQAAERYGADAFFPKPLSLSELTDKIQELLENPGAPPVQQVAPAAQQESAVDIIPKAKLLFVTVNPFASFLMKGAIHCVGDQPLEKGPPAYPDAGEYELDEAATRKEVFEKLKNFRPDFVLVAIDWKQDDIGIFRSRRITASDLITEILRSPYAPKEVFLFGSAGSNDDKLHGGIAAGTTLEEPTWGDFERQATKINKILWQKCMALGFTTKRTAS